MTIIVPDDVYEEIPPPDDRIGDMRVLGQPLPRLGRALAAIAADLHDGFERDERLVPGISRNSCVLCSLAVRDFLNQIGIEAEAVAVKTIIRAYQDREELHSTGVGFQGPQLNNDPIRWPGHMVVIADGYLIDTTLYPVVDRPAWRGEITPMIAIPLYPFDRNAPKFMDRHVLAGFEGRDGGYTLACGWLDDRENMSWQEGPDAKDPDRRATVVRSLRELFERSGDGNG